MKFGAQNINFEVANFQFPLKTRRKTSISELQRVKFGRSLARNARFGAFWRVMACFWLRLVYGGSCKTFRVRRCQSAKTPKKICQEMLVLRLPRVSCRVSGFPLAQQCLWGKLQKHICFTVSQEVVAFLWLRSVFGGSCRYISFPGAHKKSWLPLASQCL